MGQETAKSMQEMNMMNRRFYRRVKTAQSEILRKLAKINQVYSKAIVKQEVSYNGTLFSSIKLKPITKGAIIYRVISSTPEEYGGEIEFGLGKTTRKWEAPIAELNKWRVHKSAMLGKEVGRTGKEWVDVNPSPSSKGTPHPKGLFFMKKGIELARDMSHGLVELELNKLGC